jgi:hypothetical protein
VIVVITEEAEADLEQLGDAIAVDRPLRAISFVRELRGRCEGFPVLPFRRCVETPVRSSWAVFAPCSAPFPSPLTPGTNHEQICRPTFQQGRAKPLDGIAFKVVTVPHAINSKSYDGRPACEGYTSCVPLLSHQCKI